MVVVVVVVIKEGVVVTEMVMVAVRVGVVVIETVMVLLRLGLVVIEMVMVVLKLGLVESHDADKDDGDNRVGRISIPILMLVGHMREMLILKHT